MLFEICKFADNWSKRMSYFVTHDLHGNLTFLNRDMINLFSINEPSRIGVLRHISYKALVFFI